MLFDHRFFAIFILLAGIASAAAGEGDARKAARPLCPEDAPEGVRLPPQPGCHGAISRPKTARDDGFRDFGGVKLRIGGRVGAEYGIAR